MEILEKNSKTPKRRSKSEDIVEKHLKLMGIDFEYEDRFCLKGDGGLARLFYPDFHLKKYGIVVEYRGGLKPEDGETEEHYQERVEEYLERQEIKRKLYEKQGISVVEIKPDDLWILEDGNCKGVRKDFRETLTYKIYEKIYERGRNPIGLGDVKSYLGNYYSRAA